MEKILNQEEMDAMLGAARGGGSGGGEILPSQPLPSQPQVHPWDVRRAGQIGREQLRAITELHEGFARNLTHALGAYLRVVFTSALVSAEYLPYREFLERIPEMTYLASCRLDPMGVSAVLQLDLKVAFPIIDLLLGGAGTGLAAIRDLTDIEEQILGSVVRIICRELGVAWQALALNVVFEERLEGAEAGRLMLPAEKNLWLNFEVVLPEVRGGLNLAVPAVVSTALLRKISAQQSPRRFRAPGDSRQRIVRRLLEAPFVAELAARNVPVAVGALAALVPGQLLRFARRADEPASLEVAGCELFRALPARCGTARAARILERVPSTDTGGKNESKETAK